jgi:Domain of unknown function (DUF4873)
MTHHMTQDVIVVGGDLAGFPALNGDVISSVFDDDTDTWTLTTGDGETHRARVVLARTSPFVPWIPDLFGRREFRGTSFHAAAPSADFDPAGQRIAVIGADAAAGQLIGRFAKSADSITVFPLPPRRVVPPIGRAARFLRRRHVKVVASSIDEVTAVGIHTADGVHHDVDVIVYGTGFSVRAGLPPDALVGANGLTIQQAWTDGMEPYRGVALHDFPNYFIADGPTPRDVIECLELMKGHTRIEVRRSTQQVFNERVHLHQPDQRVLASAFDASSPSEGVRDDSYDGTATLTAAGTCKQVRVQLSGHVDPIDGQYHWQGTIFGLLPADLTRARRVSVAVAEQNAPARIIEETSQGAHMIAGVGAPPFSVTDLELDLAASPSTRVV